MPPLSEKEGIYYSRLNIDAADERDYRSAVREGDLRLLTRGMEVDGQRVNIYVEGHEHRDKDAIIGRVMRRVLNVK